MQRVILRSGVLAETLWQRIVESRAFTKGDLDGSDIRAFGYGAEYSAWKPIGVNNCFKISKYETGTKFVAHRDGTFAANETTATVFTLLIYLNDDFTGGETNFYTERLQNNESDNNANTESEAAALKPQYDRNDVFFTATPKMGAALIFNHDALHEGLPVLSNVKFVISVVTTTTAQLSAAHDAVMQYGTVECHTASTLTFAYEPPFAPGSADTSPPSPPPATIPATIPATPASNASAVATATTTATVVTVAEATSETSVCCGSANCKYVIDANAATHSTATND